MTIVVSLTICTMGGCSSSGPDVQSSVDTSDASDASDASTVGIDTTSTDGAPSSTSPPAVTTAPAAPLIVDDRITDEALTRAVGPDGEVDDAIAAAYVDEILALQPDRQTAVLDDLWIRAELEAASISGAGPIDPDDLRAAWDDLRGRLAQMTAPDITPADAAPAGFRRAAPPESGQAAFGAGGVGAFMGFNAVVLAADVVNVTNAGGTRTDTTPDAKGQWATATVGEVTWGVEQTGTSFGVDVTLRTLITFHPCPDPTGMFDVSATIDTRTSTPTGGQNVTIEIEAHGQVDDDANLVSTDATNHTQWSDFGGGFGQFGDWTYTGPEGSEVGQLNRTGGRLTPSFTAMVDVIARGFGRKMIRDLVAASRTAWQSGRCVALQTTASPGPGGLTPGSSSHVVASPRSKVDGAQTGGTVTATLTGAVSVAPTGKVAADAEFDYLAPDESEQSATLALEARSRRGVGKATITFDTEPAGAYLIAGGLEEFQVNQTVCDITKPFSLDGKVGVAQFSGGLTGTYVADGLFNSHYEGTYTVTLQDGLGTPGTMAATSSGQTAGQAGSGTENYTLTPQPPC